MILSQHYSLRCTTHSLDFCFAFSFSHPSCTHSNCNVSLQLLTASCYFNAEEELNWIKKLCINSHGFSLYPPIILLFKGVSLHIKMLQEKSILTHTHTCEHLFTLSHPIPSKHTSYMLLFPW